ncbi:gp16 family protein [Alkalilimnicola sp. S0819]|uniref:gp16 family protein n=1 Tax=Alkalilimnicola sp. S0819 TaxID=2613922 RepID=UPI00186AB373|nr:regulatory protein GemA [Alkalilimnicola sp. S0819]
MPASRANPRGRDARRRSELAKIHVAKKELQLDDDTYRAMLWSVARVRSAKDLDAAGREAVLDHLRARGFHGKPRRRVAQYPGTPHNLDREAMLQKIEAQLTAMKLPWSYADGIARQQFGIERVAWLRKADHLRGVIAALHVEQEKRSLLAQLDRELDRLGKTRTELAEEVRNPRKGWERHRPTLRALVEHYAEVRR